MHSPASPTLSPTSPADRTILGSDTEISSGPPTCVPSDEEILVLSPDETERRTKVQKTTHEDKHAKDDDSHGMVDAAASEALPQPPAGPTPASQPAVPEGLQAPDDGEQSQALLQPASQPAVPEGLQAHDDGEQCPPASQPAAGEGLQAPDDGEQSQPASQPAAPEALQAPDDGQQSQPLQQSPAGPDSTGVVEPAAPKQPPAGPTPPNQPILILNPARSDVDREYAAFLAATVNAAVEAAVAKAPGAGHLAPPPKAPGAKSGARSQKGKFIPTPGNEAEETLRRKLDKKNDKEARRKKRRKEEGKKPSQDVGQKKMRKRPDDRSEGGKKKSVFGAGHRLMFESLYSQNLDYYSLSFQ